MTFTPDTRWTANLWLRVRRLFLVKLFGITAVITLFFIGYFHVLRHPVRAVTTMPVTALDALVPFQPWTLGAYLSLWLYVGLAPGLQLTAAQLRVYAVWSISLCLTGLAIFYVWPTAVPPVELAGPHSGPFQMLRGMDASGNACPSMHVAFAVFTAVWLAQVLKAARVPAALHVANIAWVLAICWSTVAIRQHVVLDVVAGALLGGAFAWVSLRRRPDDVQPLESTQAALATAGKAA
jgi:membrane-associated phospholipid phosphatase